MGNHRIRLSSHRRRHTIRLKFEPLEDRRLLSAGPVEDVGAAAPKGDGVVEYHAVICGVANYSGTSNDLDYCDDDARDFRAALLEGNNWDAANIRLLIDSWVTESTVRGSINAMAAAADADDVCVFFFSGHGTRLPDVSPKDESDGYDEALCPYSFSETILDDELSEWIGALPTDKYAVIIDSCYSGGQIKSSTTMRGIGDRFSAEGDGFAADFFSDDTKDLNDLGRGVVLTACRDTEYSYEGPMWYNGVFTYYLVQGMAETADAGGDGWVSVEESFDYLRGRVAQAESSQHPMRFDGYPGELRLVRYFDGFAFNDADGLATSEGGETAAFSVALLCPPTADVVVSFASDDLSEGTVSPATITFTPLDWDVPQSVTITGRDDLVDDDDAEFFIHVSAASADPSFSGLTAGIACVNRDDEIPSPATIPFAEDFSNGALPAESWDFFSTGDGRLEVVDGTLRMDSGIGTAITLNEAVLYLDLSQTAGVVLSFDHENPANQDEPACGGLAVGQIVSTPHPEADMVAFSDDGVHWCVLALLDKSGSFEYELGSAVAAAGMDFSENFRVKFQQCGRYQWGADGRAFDNITVSADDIPPAVLDVTPGGTETAYCDRVDVEITFSEPVIGVDAADLALDGPAADVAVVGPPVNVAGSTWRFPIYRLRSGSLDVTLAPNPGDIQDLWGNDLAPTTWSCPIDANYLFMDAFTSTMFSPENWLVVEGATVDTRGLNEPSAPYAARLNSESGISDAIETVEFDLSRVYDVELHYSYQRKGGGSSPAPGEDLLVWYRDRQGQWRRMISISGSGPDMTEFTRSTVSLSRDKLHSRFQLRFSTARTNPVPVPRGDWFIDDIAITGVRRDVTILAEDDAVTTEAGGTSDFDVILSRAPEADVTIAVTSSDETEAVVSPATITFTPLDWDVPQNVTITGQDDLHWGGDAAYTISFSVESDDPSYDGLELAGLSLLNLDDDAGPANIPVLENEPPTTPGVRNTIHWPPVVGADEYLVEYDTDPDFESPEGNSGWIADSFHEFTQLTLGETFYYRVKARQIVPFGGKADGPTPNRRCRFPGCFPAISTKTDWWDRAIWTSSAPIGWKPFFPGTTGWAMCRATAL